MLLGEILNTNARYLSQQLAAIGVDVFYHITVGDNLERLAATLEQAMGRSEIVITTGGLGPTLDDLTREAVAAAAGRSLQEDQALVAALEAFFDRRGVAMTANNRRQAQLPRGGEALPNPYGTAPGIWLPTDEAVFVCLPGPPRELIPMYENHVLPRLQGARTSAGEQTNLRLYSRVLKVVGLPEATVEDRLLDLLAAQHDPTIAPYARQSEIHLRLATKAYSAAEAATRLDPLEEKIRERLGRYLFGRDDEELAAVIGRQLRQAGLTLAVAESCTGGLIGHRLTDIPGSSAYFLSGLTTYSNEAKEKLLGVPTALLERHGAVSAPVAEAMARGARRRGGSTVALAVTGIAGPGGGTEEKPVGTVYVAVDGPHGTINRRLQLLGSRTDIKARTATSALGMLREYLFQMETAARDG